MTWTYKGRTYTTLASVMKEAYKDIKLTGKPAVIIENRKEKFKIIIEK